MRARKLTVQTLVRAILHSSIGLVASIGLSGATATAAHAQAAAEFSLQVRPSICVSYDNEAPCRMSMQVSWQATVMTDVCLLQAGREDVLACWDNAREGSTEVQYADTNDVQYRLVDAKSRDLLAEADVVVINRDLRSSRKRRRHVWSIL